MLIVDERLKIPLREFNFQFSRSSGPGGQNVNKVNSKATLRWNITKSPSLPEAVRQRFLGTYRSRITTEGEFVIHSTRFRDQGRNVADCLEKLREMLLAVAKPPKSRRKTKPTKGSVRRRLDSKKQAAEKKSSRGKKWSD